MDWFGWNFQGLVDWSWLTYGWVIPVPFPQQLGLGLHQALIPGVYLLHGHWCYRVMSYHFGKHFTSQTIMWEQNILWWAKTKLAGHDGGYPKGVIFLRIGFFNKIDPCWNRILRYIYFLVLWFEAPLGYLGFFWMKNDFFDFRHFFITYTPSIIKF